MTAVEMPVAFMVSREDLEDGAATDTRINVGDTQVHNGVIPLTDTDDRHPRHGSGRM